LPHFQGVALAVAQSELVAALPAQFAEAMTKSLAVEVYRLPFPVEAPTIQLLWHARHDDDPAHRWLRQTTMETIAALRLYIAQPSAD
jgi:DNA-binding transcriptional LysR family regulator